MEQYTGVLCGYAPATASVVIWCSCSRHCCTDQELCVGVVSILHVQAVPTVAVGVD